MSNKKINLELLILAAAFLIYGLPLALAIPNSLTLQGKLTTAAGASVSGTNSFTFAIYDNTTAGNKLWELVNTSITTDVNGVYDVILTNINLSFADQYYLGITVGTDGESSPRINLTSSPYAFRANVSESLNPNSSYFVSNLSVSGHLTVGNGTASIEISTKSFNFSAITGNMNINGTVTAKSFAGDGSQLAGVVAIGSPQIFNSSGANVYFNDSTANLGLGLNNPSDRLVIIGNVRISGSLNASSINITGITLLGTNSGKVGINITSPSQTLQVLGTLNITSQNTRSGDLFVASTGFVGIGTTNPNDALEVAGNVRISGSLNATSINATVLNINNTLFVNGSRIGIGTAAPSSQVQVQYKLPASPLGSYSFGAQPIGGFDVRGNIVFISSDTTNLDIIDFSNPASPDLISSTAGGDGKGVVVRGNYLFGATGVFDISNLAAPVKVYTTSATTWTAVQGNLWITNTGSAISFYDISKPSSPVLKSNLTVTNTGQMHFSASGKHLFVSTSTGFNVYDISNPINISLNSSLSSLTSADNRFDISGSHLYIISNSGTLLNVVNITNPASPAVVSTTALDVGTTTAVNGLIIRGNQLFIANSEGAGAGSLIHAFDISLPTAPASLGSFSTGSGSRPRVLWAEGRTLYVAEKGSNKLEAYDIGGIETPAIHSGLVSTSNLYASNDIIAGHNIIANSLSGDSLQLSGNGGIGGQLAVSGSVGINTTTPSATLSVNGTLLVNPLGVTGLAVNPSGSVGIGTASPNDALEVIGNVRISGSLNASFINASQIRQNGNSVQTVESAYNIVNNATNTTSISRILDANLLQKVADFNLQNISNTTKVANILDNNVLARVGDFNLGNISNNTISLAQLDNGTIIRASNLTTLDTLNNYMRTKDFSLSNVTNSTIGLDQLDNGTIIRTGNLSLISQGNYNSANFTSNYDARTDRFGNSNATAILLNNTIIRNDNLRNALSNNTDVTFNNVLINKNLYIIGNISNVNIANLNLNGSLYPSMDSFFDIGNGSLKWRSANFSGTIQGTTLSDGSGSTITGGVINAPTVQINGKVVQASVDFNLGNISNTTSISRILDSNLLARVGDFNLQNVSNYTQYSKSADFNIGNISNTTSISRILDANLLQKVADFNLQNISNTTKVANILDNNVLARVGDFNLGNISNQTLVKGDNVTLALWNISASQTSLRNAERNLSVNGNNLFVDTTSGRVGIGTTSPSQLLTVAGNVNVSGNLNVSSDLYASGSSITLGDAASDLITVNGYFNTPLIPGDNTRDVGSPTNRWRTGYFDSLNANSLSGGNISIAGITGNTFTINTNNSGDDVDDIHLVFERGNPTTNAEIRWNSASKAFDLNFPLIIDAGQNLTVDANTLYVNGLTDSVGIGTTSPNDALEVVGNVRISGSLNASSINSTKLNINNTLFVNGSRVGIGTNVPVSALDVRGTIENGLIAWYPLDATNGSAVSDHSINSNNGSFVGSPTFVTGKIGKALNLDGTSQYVNLSNKSSQKLGTSDFTLSAWVYRNGPGSGSGYDNILSEGDYTDGYEFRIMPAGDNRLQFYAESTTTVYGNGSINSSAWYHVALTRVGAAYTFYINGVVDVSRTAGANDNIASTFDTHIGHSPNNAAIFFNGAIDDVRMYNRALSAREVAELYRFNPLGLGGTISGNLGINATTPSQTLQVLGTLNITGQNTRSGDLFVASSGNVGIGTTAPASKLEVSGTFNATQGTTSLRVTSDNNILIHLE